MNVLIKIPLIKKSLSFTVFKQLKKSSVEGYLAIKRGKKVL